MVVELIVTDVKEHALKDSAPVIKLKRHAQGNYIKECSSLHIVPGC